MKQALKFRITVLATGFVHEEYQVCEFTELGIANEMHKLYREYEIMLGQDSVKIEFVYSF